MKYYLFISFLLFSSSATAGPDIYSTINSMDSVTDWYSGLGPEYTVSMKPAYINNIVSWKARITEQADKLNLQISAMANCPAAPVSSGPTNGQLSWVPPTERMNGDPIALADVGGFYIYYGTDPHNLIIRLKIPDSHADQYTITGLDSNTDYYFAVSAYDTDGIESARSNVVMKHTQ